MLVEKQGLIKPGPDAELGIKREQDVVYRLSYDDAKEPLGILFLIGGHDANFDISALDALRNKMALALPCIVVDVFYHGFDSRFSQCEEHHPSLAPHSVQKLREALMNLNLLAPKLNEKNYLDFFAILNQAYDFMELREKKEFELELVQKDYANYGILAAIDLICVLKEVRRLHGGGGG